MDNLIKEALQEGEKFVGRTALQLIVQRIIYDLSFTNETLKGLEASLDTIDIVLDKLNDKEKKIFYCQLADILGALVNPQLKEDLLKQLEEKNEKT